MFHSVLAVLFSCILLALAHYIPWRGILRKDLPRLTRYTMGVLMLIIPVSVLWITKADWQNLILVWAVIIFGGATVYILHLVDASLENRGRADIAEEEGRQLRGQANQRD